MLYLEIFTKSLWVRPFHSLCMVLGSLSFCLLCLFESPIVGYFNHERVGPNQHFFSLIAGSENHNYLVRKLQKLPGVAKVNSWKKEEMLKGMDWLTQELSSSEIDINYNGIRVEFVRGLLPKTQTLIRDYLVRLGGEKNVSVGPVLGKFVSKNKNRDMSVLLQEYIHHLLVLFPLLMMLVGLSGLAKEVNRSAYLVEQYQRCRKVSFKSLTIGCLILFATCLIPIMLNGGAEWRHLFYLLPLFFVALFQLGDPQWD